MDVMGSICRAVLAGGLLLPLVIVLPAQAAGERAAAGKTVKECNAELQKNQDALDAAGESAATFFHACWHSEKGKPTPIVGAKAPAADAKKKSADVKAPPTDGKAPPATAQATPTDAEPTETKPAGSGTHVSDAKSAAEATIRRSRHAEHRARDERRYASSRRQFRRRFYARASREPSIYSEAIGPNLLPPPRFPPAQVLPSQVNVNIPMVGSISAPILPVPGLAATVRDVVANPVVPGLVTATP